MEAACGDGRNAEYSCGMTPLREWVRCKPWIEAAIAASPGFETIEDVERLLEREVYQLWAGKNCAAIGTFNEYESETAYCIVHGGGDLTELLDVVEPAVCAWATQSGCNVVMGIGRKGWERVCSKRGYKFGWIAMVKRLDGPEHSIEDREPN